jgi:hypothetical protein
MNTDDLRKRADEDEAKAIEKMGKIRKRFRVFYSGDEYNIDDELFFEQKHPYESFFFNTYLYIEELFIKKGIISADKESSPEAEAKKEIILIFTFLAPIILVGFSLAGMFLKIFAMYMGLV